MGQAFKLGDAADESQLDGARRPISLLADDDSPKVGRLCPVFLRTTRRTASLPSRVWPAMIGTYKNTEDAIEAAKERQRHLESIAAEKKCPAIS